MSGTNCFLLSVSHNRNENFNKKVANFNKVIMFWDSSNNLLQSDFEIRAVFSKGCCLYKYFL